MNVWKIHEDASFADGEQQDHIALNLLASASGYPDFDYEDTWRVDLTLSGGGNMTLWLSEERYRQFLAAWEAA